MTVENVKITSTFLGREDHGILTCYLRVEANTFETGIGGYTLDIYDKQKNKRIPTQRGFELINRILEVVGVSSWEELTGKHIRVEKDSPFGKITKIGHLIKDEWLDFKMFFEETTHEHK